MSGTHVLSTTTASSHLTEFSQKLIKLEACPFHDCETLIGGKPQQVQTSSTSLVAAGRRFGNTLSRSQSKAINLISRGVRGSTIVSTFGTGNPHQREWSRPNAQLAIHVTVEKPFITTRTSRRRDTAQSTVGCTIAVGHSARHPDRRRTHCESCLSVRRGPCAF